MGYSPWGCKESDTTEWLSTTQHPRLSPLKYFCFRRTRQVEPSPPLLTIRARDGARKRTIRIEGTIWNGNKCQCTGLAPLASDEPRAWGSEWAEGWSLFKRSVTFIVSLALEAPDASGDCHSVCSIWDVLAAQEGKLYRSFKDAFCFALHLLSITGLKIRQPDQALDLHIVQGHLKSSRKISDNSGPPSSFLYLLLSSQPVGTPSLSPLESDILPISSPPVSPTLPEHKDYASLVYTLFWNRFDSRVSGSWDICRKSFAPAMTCLTYWRHFRHQKVSERELEGWELAKINVAENLSLHSQLKAHSAQEHLQPKPKSTGNPSSPSPQYPMQ